MTWATQSDVATLTGATVDTDSVVQAQAIIELFVGISEQNTTELTTGNARMLKAAVAYQAAWLESQVDVTGRMGVSEIDQDGVTVTPGSPDDLVIAPLAKRAVQRLSWMGRHGIALRPEHSRRRHSTEAEFLSDRGGAGWSALPGYGGAA